MPHPKHTEEPSGRSADRETVASTGFIRHTLVGFALWIGGYRISISVRLRVLDT
jgi:hypothetical protein